MGTAAQQTLSVEDEYRIGRMVMRGLRESGAHPRGPGDQRIHPVARPAAVEPDEPGQPRLQLLPGATTGPSTPSRCRAGSSASTRACCSTRATRASSPACSRTRCRTSRSATSRAASRPAARTNLMSTAAMLAAILLGAIAGVGFERDDGRDHRGAGHRGGGAASASPARTRTRPIASASASWPTRDSTRTRCPPSSRRWAAGPS